MKQALDERNMYTLWQIQLTEQEIALYDDMIADKSIEVDEAKALELEQLDKYRAACAPWRSTEAMTSSHTFSTPPDLGELLTAVDDIGEIMESDRNLEDAYIEARQNTEAVVAEYEEYKADIVDKQDELRGEQQQLQSELTRPPSL